MMKFGMVVIIFCLYCLVSFACFGLAFFTQAPGFARILIGVFWVGVSCLVLGLEGEIIFGD